MNTLFRAPFGLSNPIIQTGIANIKKFQYTNKTKGWNTVKLNNSIFNKAYQCTHELYTKADNNSLCIFLHGLEGSSQEAITQRSALVLEQNSSCDIALFNARSCGPSAPLFAHPYSSYDTKDIKLLLDYLCSKKSYENIFLVGFSLGALNAVHFLNSITLNDYPTIHSLHVSCPGDLNECYKKLANYPGKYIQHFFLNKLIKKFKLLNHHNSSYYNELGINASKVIQSKTLRTFDQEFTVKINKIHSLEVYVKQSYPSKTSNNMYFLSSLDDPAVGSSHLNSVKRTNKHLSQHGGHVGFYHNSLKNDWLPQLILNFTQQEPRLCFLQG